MKEVELAKEYDSMLLELVLFMLDEIVLLEIVFSSLVFILLIYKGTEGNIYVYFFAKATSCPVYQRA